MGRNSTTYVQSQGRMECIIKYVHTAEHGGRVKTGMPRVISKWLFPSRFYSFAEALRAFQRAVATGDSEAFRSSKFRALEWPICEAFRLKQV